MKSLRARVFALAFLPAAWLPSLVDAQTECLTPPASSSPNENAETQIMPIRLPPVTLIQELEVSETPTTAAGRPPVDIAALMRPRFSFEAGWEPEVDGVAIGTVGGSIRFPLYPVFGPPPPFITAGYDFTQLEAPASLDLPSSMHEFSTGLAWMRRINERWMLRFMLSGAFATDLHNTGGDAWRMRGGGFAIYRPNERWSLAVGAMATGRMDIPVLPAAGLIWQPTPALTVNLMMPRPRISWMIIERDNRQHWVYIGGAIDGGDWAYERANGVGDRLEYREWRLVLGWESMPPKPLGAFMSTGTTINAEVGYVFGREFEFKSATPDISIGNAVLLRAGIRF